MVHTLFKTVVGAEPESMACVLIWIQLESQPAPAVPSLPALLSFYYIQAP